MAFKKNDDFSFEIEEFIGSIKESDKSDWCKAVLKMKWGDNPTTIDIRNMNMNTDNKRVGKGISLSSEEVDKMISILLDEGYGKLEDLEKAIEKKRSFFKISADIDKIYDDEDDGPIIIDVG